jgi:hypothetical protein
VFQELDDFLQFGGGLIAATHVFVGDASFLRLDLGGLAFTNPEDTAHTAGRTASHALVAEVPQATQQDQRHAVRQQKLSHRAGRLLDLVLHPGGIQLLN